MMIAKGWEQFLNENSEVVSRIIRTLKQKENEMTCLPEKRNVFRMFRLLPANEIRVVIMSQDPYPTSCPITSISYASGVAFMPDERTKKVPKTLIEMETELYRDLGIRKHIDQKTFAHWISQGIFLTNLALTVGTRCPDNLINHKILWEQFSRLFVKFLSKRGNIVFCLVGTEAWRVKEDINSTCSVIKVYLPTSNLKGEKKTFSGCSMYTKINTELEKLGQKGIDW